MDNNTIIIIGVLIFSLLGVLVWAFKSSAKNKYYREKYSKIIDIDAAVELSKKEKDAVDNDISTLRGSYSEKRKIFDELVREAAIYNEEIELAELGFYKPHFDFDTSEKYKDQIRSAKEDQKMMISAKTAIYCTTEWSVEGSKAKGRTMTNRGIRLTARAFNNECDSAISNARWNNAVRMEERIKKAFAAINKLNASNAIYIKQQYLDLKIKELRLTHEYKEKKQQEKEEQAEIRRQMREESKLHQDLEKSVKEEEKYLKLLAKAKAEVEKASGAKLEKLNAKISSLSDELEVAHAKSTRAKSMAEQTKSGHVYVISNIGSFGENIYKIGMTRRLEPIDRVKELGDASVPFVFDIHAMIYSEDAPALEHSLHKVFEINRLNLVNSRKEFFTIGLDEIKNEALKVSPNAEFIETAEARQYHESIAIREQRKEKSEEVNVIDKFPDSI